MNDYTYRVMLEQLLEDAIKNLPDEGVLKQGLGLMDEDGFKYTILKVGKRKGSEDKLYKLKCNRDIKIVDAKEIKKYKRV
jgi:hypothetical protein